MEPRWILSFTLAIILVLGQHTEAQALTQKQQQEQARFYKECTTTDAATHKLFLDAYGLRRSKLNAYCRCQAAISGRYEGTSAWFGKMSEAPMICARKLGGHLP